MFFLILSIEGFAQKHFKKYYDSLDHRVSNPSDAYYYHVADTSKVNIRVTYYYTDGNVYAQGKASWKRSGHDLYLERKGKWTYYYPYGRKQQILRNKICVHYWYENGVTSYKSKKVYSFCFHGWYFKHRSWYASGQLKTEGLTDMNNSKYGYYRSYTHNGKRWLEEYFAESNLQGVSVYMDASWRVKYFIGVDNMSFEDVSFDPKMLKVGTQGVSFIEAKEGFNELIYDTDTFRFTVRNGYMEGPYYHNEGRRGIKQIGFYHNNYKTGKWLTHVPSKKGSYINYFTEYKKGCIHGVSCAFLNDTILLMKEHYRYSKRNGKSFSMNGFFADPRYTWDGGFYFIEEKYKNDKQIENYSKVYAADKSTYAIQYLKWKSKRTCFLTENYVRIEYYPNHQVKRRTIHKKQYAVDKLYDESGKRTSKKRIFYE
ncbi:hypothetical protein [Cytophaga aurantiaca]|uniref:hypothetical protein n=1 Tax=Cytophaga aurantiaca TaxID=29530 RepID=UPI0012F882D2|nr:hypothetical protein [Cytophaga aurantiaca]